MWVMKNRVILIYAVLVAVIGIFLVGCATAPSGSTGTTQADLLAQAGFKAHSPNSSQRMAYVQTLPAKKVVLNQYNEKPLYLVCTDPDSKQCYVGDQAAYERYKELATQQAISEDQRNVQEHRWDPEAWQMWVDSQGGG
jgi:hypothetical protein